MISAETYSNHHSSGGEASLRGYGKYQTVPRYLCQKIPSHGNCTKHMILYMFTVCLRETFPSKQSLICILAITSNY
jgi:hypothetical protein